MRVTFSKEAARFLRRERSYLERVNPRAADAVMRQFQATFRLLGEFPRAGSDFTALEGRRSFVAGAYVIYYRIEKGAVAISFIRHGRQDTPDLEKDADEAFE